MMVMAFLLLSLALVMTGCAQKPGTVSGPGTENSGAAPGAGDRMAEGVKEPGSQKPDISAKPVQTSEKVTLYFGDGQAMYLVPEEREVTRRDETLEEVIIRELIKGPRKAGLTRTIPESAGLLSVSVVDGVAYTNFSKEFKTKHWGGSAGENMTIFSVVNSLAKLPGIKKVQFLLEGEKQESILGHADTSVPIAPDWSLVSGQETS
jgi:spore germination protein GerM